MNKDPLLTIFALANAGLQVPTAFRGASIDFSKEFEAAHTLESYNTTKRRGD